MDLKGLTEFQKDLLRTSENINKEMPKGLRKVGNKARTIVAKKGRMLVNKQTGMYRKKWKRGKVFKGNDGSWIVRVFNSSPHAHLIEDGHRMVTKDGREIGFVRGKKVLKKGMDEFDSSGVADEIFGDWLDELLEKNKL